MLLPLKGGDGALQWKIWVLSTRLESLDLQPEDETLLQAPARQLDGLERFETDVFIVGGGNAYVSHMQLPVEQGHHIMPSLSVIH